MLNYPNYAYMGPTMEFQDYVIQFNAMTDLQFSFKWGRQHRHNLGIYVSIMVVNWTSFWTKTWTYISGGGWTEHIQVEGMRFILNCSNYVYMGPTMEFQDYVIHSAIADLRFPLKWGRQQRDMGHSCPTHITKWAFLLCVFSNSGHVGFDTMTELLESNIKSNWW